LLQGKNLKNFSISLCLGLCLGLCVLALSACGFDPVYGDKAPVSSQAKEQSTQQIFNDIEIALIPDWSGQFLRNQLMDRFYVAGTAPQTNPRYKLEIAPIAEQILQLDVTKEAETTRAQMRMRSNMILRDQMTNQIVLQRDLSSSSSYNILGSEFASQVAAKAAREGTLQDLARQIELAVSLYFRSNPQPQKLNITPGIVVRTGVVGRL
jgi:LPS-assembly lipoprotein